MYSVHIVNKSVIGTSTTSSTSSCSHRQHMKHLSNKENMSATNSQSDMRDVTSSIKQTLVFILIINQWVIRTIHRWTNRSMEINIIVKENQYLYINRVVVGDCMVIMVSCSLLYHFSCIKHMVCASVCFVTVGYPSTLCPLGVLNVFIDK